MVGVAAIVGGCILIAVILQDAFEVVLLNRPVRRRTRLMRYFFKGAWAAWAGSCARIKSDTKHEAVLGLFGPAAMVLLFSLWAALIILGFGLLQWGMYLLIGDGAGSLSADVRGSGDAFFTLSYSDLLPRSSLTHLLVLIEAGTGFGFIALTVSYLPVLDHHFTQRDAKLITMEARAGSPPTSVSLLLWHAQHGNLEHLNEWLRSWELWSAGLIESHSSYPMLAFYRSQHSNQSWLASLAVVLDCCTILLAAFDEEVVQQAECTCVAALRVLVEVNQALALRERPGTSERKVTPDLYGRIKDAIVHAGYDWKGDEASLAKINRLNTTYEPLLSNISGYLHLALPEWLPPSSVARQNSRDRDAAIDRLTTGEAERAERS